MGKIIALILTISTGVSWLIKELSKRTIENRFKEREQRIFKELELKFNSAEQIWKKKFELTEIIWNKFLNHFELINYNNENIDKQYETLELLLKTVRKYEPFLNNDLITKLYLYIEDAEPTSLLLNKEKIINHRIAIRLEINKFLNIL